jgi:hypothetical protein
MLKKTEPDGFLLAPSLVVSIRRHCRPQPCSSFCRNRRTKCFVGSSPCSDRAHTERSHGRNVLQLNKLFKTEKAKATAEPPQREQTPTRLHRGQDTPRHLVGTYFSFQQRLKPSYVFDLQVLEEECTRRSRARARQRGPDAQRTRTTLVYREVRRDEYALDRRLQVGGERREAQWRQRGVLGEVEASGQAAVQRVTVPDTRFVIGQRAGHDAQVAEVVKRTGATTHASAFPLPTPLPPLARCNVTQNRTCGPPPPNTRGSPLERRACGGARSRPVEIRGGMTPLHPGRSRWSVFAGGRCFRPANLPRGT